MVLYILTFTFLDSRQGDKRLNRMIASIRHFIYSLTTLVIRMNVETDPAFYRSSNRRSDWSTAVVIDWPQLFSCLLLHT
jgi:hypothetical protein